MPEETRLEQLKRLEENGVLDPNCEYCQREFYARENTMPCDVFAPRHRSGARCRSGGRPHCTCDSCF